jgi:hypothetical protein
MLRTKSEIQLNIFWRNTHFLISSIFLYKFSNLGKGKNAKYSSYWILQVFSGVTNTCIKSITFNTRFYQFYARPWIKLIKTSAVCDRFNTCLCIHIYIYIYKYIYIWYLLIPMGMSHLKISLVYFVTKTTGVVTPYTANIKTWTGHVRKLCGLHVGHTCSGPSIDPFLQLATCLFLMQSSRKINHICKD